jgi:molybdenum cofactor guanylyltransferase
VRRLGAILAGGGARRFGGDKAAALVGGRALIDHVVAGLLPQVDAVIVVGRDWRGLVRAEDAPHPHIGPLGGLCGALDYANTHGFGAVVSHPCDLLPVPDWTINGMSLGGPAYAARHYVAGVWPVALHEPLSRFLTEGENHSVRAWISRCGARPVECGPMEDLNTRAALKKYADRTGRTA